VEELSRILDHQTRVTDALSHEMSSIRGRIDISDFRSREKQIEASDRQLSTSKSSPYEVELF